MAAGGQSQNEVMQQVGGRAHDESSGVAGVGGGVQGWLGCVLRRKIFVGPRDTEEVCGQAGLVGIRVHSPEFTSPDT